MDLVEEHMHNPLLKNKKNKITPWILIFVFAGPLVTAQLLYIFRDHFHFSTLETGTLLSPPLSVQTLPGFEAAFLGKWQLIYIRPEPCDTQCESLTPPLKQIHLAVGKENYRVEYRSLSAQDIPVLKPGDIALIDPAGWLIMQYPQHANPRGIVKDLRRLLGISHAG